jgi:ABC-type branched-subunit amino acid transport system substrate-binding protein
MPRIKGLRKIGYFDCPGGGQVYDTRTSATRTARVEQPSSTLRIRNPDLPARSEYWKNLGEKGTYATFIVHYQPRMKLTARGEAMSRRYRETFKEDPVYPALNAYSQVILIADAITAARSDKGEDIAKALLANKFEGWNATVSFTRGDGPYWQQWTDAVHPAGHALRGGDDRVSPGVQDGRLGTGPRR